MHKVPLPYTHALKKFGENLQRARRERGVSQDQLATAIGVNRTYVSLVEKGERNPTLRFMYRAAKALGVHSSDLLSF